MPRSDQIVATAPRRSWLARHAAQLVTLEVIVLIAVVAALTQTTAGYVVAGVIALLLLVCLIPFGGRSLVGRLGRALTFAGRRPRRHATPDLPDDLVPLAQWAPHLYVSQTATRNGDEVGIIEDGEAFTAVLALTADDDVLADPSVGIDLGGLSGLTVQDDIVFAGVQVVTYTVPAASELVLGPGSPAAQAYREIAAAAPPPAVRLTWLCVRLDPRLCLPAVARRGTSTAGIHATLRFGLHRVQSALKRQGVETRVCDPLEISDVLALTVGAGPEQPAERTHESWATWSCDALVHTACAVRGLGSDPSARYEQLLQAVAAAPALVAVTSLTYEPERGATGAVRLVTSTSEEAKAARSAVAAQLSGVKLSPPGGTQVPAVLGTVPLGRGVAA